MFCSKDEESVIVMEYMSKEYFEYYRDAYADKYITLSNKYKESFKASVKTIEKAPSGHKLSGVLIKECSECFQRFVLVSGVFSLYWVRDWRNSDIKQEIEECSVAKMKRALL